tara:strand:+ start:1104 stop:1355 length:252 start_codon:yes stop_codon:yes gene_type:complete
MGLSNTKYIMEDAMPHQFSYNRCLKLSAWDYHNPKNFDYYSGERFCKISRSLYPQYTRGYIYGYYEDENYFKPLEDEIYEMSF